MLKELWHCRKCDIFLLCDHDTSHNTTTVLPAKEVSLERYCYQNKVTLYDCTI